MQYSLSLHIRFLLLITGGLTQCLALKFISVIQGDTLTLTCPITNMMDVTEWRNPDGLIMFFNTNKVLKDERNHFVSLNKTKFTIQVTDITFKHGGVYKCVRYNEKVSTKRFKVIVVGAPKLEKYQEEDTAIIKCSASANEHPPKLSWIMDNGLEIHPLPYFEFQNSSKKYTTFSQLNVNVPKKRVTVKCLVRHPALYGSTVENFIHIGMQSEDTTTSSKVVTTTSPIHISTTLGSTEKTDIPTVFSSTRFTNTQSESESTNYSIITVNETTNGTSSNVSTTISSNTTANETTEITEGTPLNTSTETSGNNTGNDNSHINRQSKKGNSALLVMLVTCLIICLFVVLVFFLVRLRKAHIAWKKENEESDQSVESNRSKSSSEEKQKQQQRVQGFWNTSFTKYKAEETPDTESQTTSVSVQVNNPNSQNFISKSGIKETEL